MPLGRPRPHPRRRPTIGAATQRRVAGRGRRGKALRRPAGGWRQVLRPAKSAWVAARENPAAAAAVAASAAAVISSIVAAIALWFTSAQIEVAEQGQVTERFNRAVSQLGDPALDVRLGGVYSLERLARDSPGDQPAIVEIISAYIRDHLPPAGPACPQIIPGVSRPLLTSDVQSAIVVLARRSRSADQGATADLTRVCAPIGNPPLGGTDFTGFSFAVADLNGAFLKGKDFSGDTLPGTKLSNAHLASTLWFDADLERTDFSGADLSAARFEGADLTGAVLVGANLTGTTFQDADLTGADMRGAVGADLSGASHLPAHLPDGP